jgi:hypothetical protein
MPEPVKITTVEQSNDLSRILGVKTVAGEDRVVQVPAIEIFDPADVAAINTAAANAQAAAVTAVAAANSLALPLNARLVEKTQIIGLPATLTPVAGTNGASVTYIKLDPFQGSGVIDAVKFYSSGAGPVKIFRSTRVGDTWTPVGAVTTLTAVGGLNSFSVAASTMAAITVNSGEYIGYYGATLVQLTSGAQADGLGYVNSAAGDFTATGFTDSTPTTNNRLQISFTAKVGKFVDSDAYDATYAQRLGEAEEEVTIGVDVPVLGTVVSATINFMTGVAFTDDGWITEVQFYALAAGRLAVKIYDNSGLPLAAGGSVTQTSEVLSFNPTSDGLKTYSVTNGDFLPVPVKKGQRPGYYGIGVLTFTARTPSGGGFFTLPAGKETGTVTAGSTNQDLNIRLKYKARAKTTPPAPVFADVNHVAFYGQSNSVGADATPAISLTASARHITFNVGPKATKPGMTGGTLADDLAFKALAEDDSVPFGATPHGETSCSGFAVGYNRYAANGAGQRTFFMSAAGRSGAAAASILPHAVWYGNLVYHITRGKAYATGVSKSYAFSAIVMDHGETDALVDQPKANYRRMIDSIVTEATRAAKVTTGQARPPVWLFSVSPYGVAVGHGPTDAIIEKCAQTPDCHFYLSGYRLPRANGFHYSNNGQRLKGHYAARALHQLAAGKLVPDRLYWRSATFNGTTVTAIISGPTACTFNTAIPASDLGATAATTDFGFKVVDGTGTLTLSALACSAGVLNPATGLVDTTITMTVNRALAANPVLRYGLDFLAAGRTISSGADGNVYDSTTETVAVGGTTYIMAHSAYPVEMAVQAYE